MNHNSSSTLLLETLAKRPAPQARGRIQYAGPRQPFQSNFIDNRGCCPDATIVTAASDFHVGTRIDGPRLARTAVGTIPVQGYNLDAPRGLFPGRRGSAGSRDMGTTMSATLMSLIIQIIGGNGAGASLKNLTLGPIGNTIAGAIGGGVGGRLLQLAIPIRSGAGGHMDPAAMAGQLVGGGVAGGILTAVVGAVKNAMGGSQPAK